MAKLFIHQLATDHDSRPPISGKVREHLQALADKWIMADRDAGFDQDVLIDLYFIDPNTEGPSDIFLQPSKKIKPGLARKPFTVFIPQTLIESASDPYKATIQLMVDTVILVFSREFPGLKPGSLPKFKKAVDFEYLMSLPYPAPFDEQQYISDNIDG